MGCQFDNCENKAHARGLCQGHYKQLREGRPLAPLRDFTYWNGADCRVDRCAREVFAGGLCNPHNRKARRLGLRSDVARDFFSRTSCQRCGAVRKLHLGTAGMLCIQCINNEELSNPRRQ